MKDDQPTTKEVAKATPANELQRFNWTGLNPAQMKGVAQAMAMSGMFPDIQRDSAKAFVKIMAGQEMGIAPFQAMSDISIIQGKAAAGGNIYAAKVKSHPRYDYRVKDWTAQGCAIEFFEITGGKRESLGVSRFDEADADRAGLLGKDNWKTYPRNMYFNRAMTAGVRTYCPDALNGINAYTPEELGAEVDEDGRAVVTSTATFAQPVETPAPVEPVDNNTNEAVDEEPQEDVVQPDEPDPYAEDAQAIAAELEGEPQPRKVYTVPEFPESKGSGKIVPQAMLDQIKKFNEELGLNEAEQAELIESVLGEGKTRPGLRSQAQAVLEAQVEELNLRQAAQTADKEAP